ncbi:conserved Plasmodium protein, unknown function [Plasmodium ovale]|uniref:Uncharacterized protein n=2 Tax=Plasmodium ovale TaxID=36330 RepID=A0A1A8WHR4_PLAOA|nr:conserved Plasmodium protein, unknown function [Plasmodium ovale curtisi]SCA48540.1 conserved Plasmodium protein, unknown function [Plasmodium ovale]
MILPPLFINQKKEKNENEAKRVNDHVIKCYNVPGNVNEHMFLFLLQLLNNESFVIKQIVKPINEETSLYPWKIICNDKLAFFLLKKKKILIYVDCENSNKILIKIEKENNSNGKVWDGNDIPSKVLDKNENDRDSEKGECINNYLGVKDEKVDTCFQEETKLLKSFDGCNKSWEQFSKGYEQLGEYTGMVYGINKKNETVNERITIQGKEDKINNHYSGKEEREKYLATKTEGVYFRPNEEKHSKMIRIGNNNDIEYCEYPVGEDIDEEWDSYTYSDGDSNSYSDGDSDSYSDVISDGGSSDKPQGEEVKGVKRMKTNSTCQECSSEGIKGGKTGGKSQERSEEHNGGSGARNGKVTKDSEVPQWKNNLHENSKHKEMEDYNEKVNYISKKCERENCSDCYLRNMEHSSKEENEVCHKKSETHGKKYNIKKDLSEGGGKNNSNVSDLKRSIELKSGDPFFRIGDICIDKCKDEMASETNEIIENWCNDLSEEEKGMVKKGEKKRKRKDYYEKTFYAERKEDILCDILTREEYDLLETLKRKKKHLKKKKNSRKKFPIYFIEGALDEVIEDIREEDRKKILPSVEETIHDCEMSLHFGRSEDGTIDQKVKTERDSESAHCKGEEMGVTKKGKVEEEEKQAGKQGDKLRATTGKKYDEKKEILENYGVEGNLSKYQPNTSSEKSRNKTNKRDDQNGSEIVGGCKTDDTLKRWPKHLRWKEIPEDIKEKFCVVVKNKPPEWNEYDLRKFIESQYVNKKYAPIFEDIFITKNCPTIATVALKDELAKKKFLSNEKFKLPYSLRKFNYDNNSNSSKTNYYYSNRYSSFLLLQEYMISHNLNQTNYYKKQFHDKNESFMDFPGKMKNMQYEYTSGASGEFSKREGMPTHEGRRDGSERRRGGDEHRRGGDERRRNDDDRRRDDIERRRDANERRRNDSKRRTNGIERRRDGSERRTNDIERRRDGSERRTNGIERRRDGSERRTNGIEHRRDGSERRTNGIEHRRDGSDRRDDMKRRRDGS